MENTKDIVLAGVVGAGLARRLLNEYEQELKDRFSTSFLRQARDTARFVVTGEIMELIREAAAGEDPVEHRDCRKSRSCILTGRGGIFAALWHLAEAEDAGLETAFDRIPIPQELIEVFNYLDADPYTSDDAGSVLIAAPEGRTARELVRRLESRGIPAAIIGELTDTKARIVMREDTCCYLNKPERGSR